MASFTVACSAALFSVLAAPLAPADDSGPAEKPVRLGIVGCDTSHVTAFTRMLNEPSAGDHVAGARVVAAWPGGSPDLEASASRVDRFTAELRDRYRVEIVPDIPTLCGRVDGVLLESVDGRPHLQQLRAILPSRKPVYIDKPLAGSLEDAREIVRIAGEAGVPCFSASSLRFWTEVTKIQGDAGLGSILAVDAYSPCHLEPHHPDLYWYGVHGVEILFTLMGPGCVEVSRTAAEGQDLVVGRWRDGRIGTFRGLRSGAHGYGARVFAQRGIRSTGPVKGSLYRPLVVEIVRFVRTGRPPVPLEQTLEIFEFMSAADRSKEAGGKPVRLPAAAKAEDSRPPLAPGAARS